MSATGSDNQDKSDLPQDEMSMEDILSSIKQIIAEDEPLTAETAQSDDSTTATHSPDDEEALELTEALPTETVAEDEAEELELTEEVPTFPADMPEPALTVAEESSDKGIATPDALGILGAVDQASPAFGEFAKVDALEKAAGAETVTDEEDKSSGNILSAEAVVATSNAFDELARTLTTSYDKEDDTVEGLVRSMLRPMLREWLNANLPDLVEREVGKEIRRVSAIGTRTFDDAEDE